jgi:hypothetical protein
MEPEMNFDRAVNFVTRTSGDGYWSIQIKTVRINRVVLASVTDEGDFGELRAYFDTRDWDVENDGLIYSDMGWKHSFLTCMENEFGLSPDAILDLSYSEHGMQCDNYVSMDVGPQFIMECNALYRFIIHREAVNF